MTGGTNSNETWRTPACALAVFVLAFALRFLPVLLWPTMGHPDEVFQAVEQGHRLVFGYGIVPWEFEHGARSWLLAYVCAGLIRFSLIFGDSPDIYLPIIGAAFSLLTGSSAVCAFLWARRQFGTALGLVAALVPICWVDCVFYGARAMSEPVAASLLVLGLYLAFPGRPVLSSPRLVLAGALLAASVIFRMQLAPAVVLAWLWNYQDGWRRRAMLMAAGAVVILALDGWFDAMTWNFPFEPLWRNFSFNILQHVADVYGIRSWWWYIYDYAGAWGGTLPVFLALAMIGARRLPLAFLMGLVICAAHFLVPHKETRFLFPAVTLFATCAGFGLVQVGLWLRDGMADGRRRQATIFAALSAGWLVLSGINVFGLDYAEYWDGHQHDAWVATSRLYRAPPACGLGIYSQDVLRSGGYSRLHHRIPIYPITSGAGSLADAVRDFDTAVVDLDQSPPIIAALNSLGYRVEACFSGQCILRRPGRCRGTPMPKPEGPRNIDLGPSPYPQRQGVND